MSFFCPRGTQSRRPTVRGLVRVAGVVEGIRDGPGEPEALVERADGKPPGVAGALAWRWFEDERNTKEVQDLWPGGGYTPQGSPWLQKGLAAHPVGRAGTCAMPPSTPGARAIP